MKFKNLLNLFLVFTLCSCAGGIQKTYWGAGNTVAFDEEKKEILKLLKMNIKELFGELKTI